MSESENDWLSLCEPHDHAARCVDLTARFASALGADSRIIDLACGTGSNIRFLDGRLCTAPRWLAVDHDATLLARAAALLPDVEVQFEQRDLASELSSLQLGPGTAVTTSAFLDMTSAVWLDQLAAWCRATPAGGSSEVYLT